MDVIIAMANVDPADTVIVTLPDGVTQVTLPDPGTGATETVVTCNPGANAIAIAATST